ncbi:MAG: type II toxin-antitoxin system RelE/ParE family toxin [Magnetospiraceae bacterium]
MARRAAEDLLEIASDTVKTFSPKQAHVYRDDFNDCFANLAANPRLGRNQDHLRLGLRQIAQQSHAIFYAETDGGILIVPILHRAQEPLRNIAEE